MYNNIKENMENIFNFLNVFRNKYLKIYPRDNISNRERSKTEYCIDGDDYQEILYEEYKRKMEYKYNKKGSALRIRGSSF